jgi:hypothetical protein
LKLINLIKEIVKKTELKTKKHNPKTYGLKSLKEWLQILGKDFNKKNETKKETK